MQEVRFNRRFMDWKKGDKVKLNKRFADKYTRMGVCAKVKPPPKRKAAAADRNKMVTVAANK